MRKLGEYLLRGRIQAITVTGFLTLVSFLVPVFSWLLSGLPPGLVTLRKGPVTGLQVIIGSTLLIAVFALIAGMKPQIAVAVAIGIWLPVWCGCSVLRFTESQGMAIVAAGACGLVYILLMHGMLDDVTAWWQDWLEVWLEQTVTAQQGEQFREVLMSAAPYVNAVMAIGLVTSLAITVLVARWWQSLLFNPGGFRQEFHALHLPRWLFIPVVAGVVMLLLDQAKPGSWVIDVLVLAVFLFLFQGLAMLHRIVAVKKLSPGWLAGMYVLLFVIPQVALFIACLGMVDSWLMKAGPAAPNDNQ